ncbi:acyl-CoA dehydrogenase [Leisingera aquaemixtae]|uniref:acyl-CoA dehydrogenase family protein n=1 Tax=Leisingera aquaemixtae TaxID=1396826 RepID=UPI0021A82924|nr:acyl-CoA dehydrogenase [Leisingera aquaemixtae]UWQ37711.1 acyl-CoA dehydrogenase [Leisingera aquaemixtae]
MLDIAFDKGDSPLAASIGKAGQTWNSSAEPPAPDCPRWQALSETGLFRLACDRDKPFAERNIGIIHAMERLGEECRDGGFTFAVATHLASTLTALDRFASAELRAEVLPDLVAGRRIGAHAISEAEAGSDALAMTTTARRDGPDYVLDGDKAFVTNGPIADVFVIYARTAGTGAGSVSAFLVDRDTPGLTVAGAKPLVGLKTSMNGPLQLRGCRVPASRLVGREGAGFMVLSHVMKQEILYSFMANVGQMKHTLARCVRHVRRRRQFDRPIGDFQAVSHRIANMKMRYEISRQCILTAAARQARNKDVTSDVAIAKIYVSEALLANAIDAVHLHGGVGYLEETGLGEGVADALAAPIYSGTNDIQRGRIAAMMGVGS